MRQDNSNNSETQQNELGDRMVNAADLIGREVESLRQESNELEQIHMALTRSLKMLSTVRPDEWPIENTDNLISQGQQVIDRCEEEFADAVQQCAPGCAAPAKCASAPVNS